MALALPGRWLRLPVSAPDARGRFVAAAVPEVGEHAGSELAARLDAFAVAGGDLMMLRTGTNRPAMILTSWPPEPEARRAPGVASLRERTTGEYATGEAVEMENAHGYAVLRTRVEDRPDTRPRVIYWVTDPELGRLFCMDVTYFGSDPHREDPEAASWTEPYDLLVEYLRWKEPTGGG